MPSSSNEVLATLDQIVKWGFRPVPLRKQSKASLDEKYVDLNYIPPPRKLWEERDLGVGVVTGPKYKGPVDVDIDCAEAQFFAQKFLPRTRAIFGRDSKRHSHYLYKVEADSVPKRAFMDPVLKAGTCIVELRGDGGHQTVFPGSVHESTGEVIQWEVEQPEVEKVDLAALEFAVKKVAIAVLVTRHMWAEGQRNEIVKHLSGLLYYMEWPIEETQSLIRAVMEFTDDDDKTRLRTVTATYRKGTEGGKVTGSNTLRAFLGDDRVVDRIQEWSGSSEAAFLQDYNERFAVVSVKGKFRVAETIPLEQGGVPVLFAKEDFINLHSTDTATIQDAKGKPVRVSKAKLWLGHPRRRSYKGLDFVPGEEDTSPILNLWTGWAVDPKVAAHSSCRVWLDLLYYTICGQNDDLYNWMMNWFVSILREPRNKPLTAPVIIGKQGAGKSLLLSYFGKMLGPAYVVVTNEEHIYGRFNKHLATALLLHSEEALYGGDRKHRGIIKSLITDEYRIFEQKGVDAERVHNYLRLALTSNEIWAAPTEADDRRFTIIDMEYRKAPDDVVKEVLKEMHEGGPSALFHYMTEEFAYDASIPRVNVKNESMANLKAINFDPTASWWYETLRLGCLLPDYLSWAAKPAGQEWPGVVSSSALHMALAVHCRARNKVVPDQTSLALALNKMTGGKLDRRQMYYVNPMSDDVLREIRLMPQKQSSITNMPPLAACRTAFEHFMGQRVNWPVEADEADKPVHLRY